MGTRFYSFIEVYLGLVAVDLAEHFFRPAWGRQSDVRCAAHIGLKSDIRRLPRRANFRHRQPLSPRFFRRKSFGQSQFTRAFCERRGLPVRVFSARTVLTDGKSARPGFDLGERGTGNSGAMRFHQLTAMCQQWKEPTMPAKSTMRSSSEPRVQGLVPAPPATPPPQLPPIPPT
jgi:hypothetical protein